MTKKEMIHTLICKSEKTWREYLESCSVNGCDDQHTIMLGVKLETLDSLLEEFTGYKWVYNERYGYMTVARY